MPGGLRRGDIQHDCFRQPDGRARSQLAFARRLGGSEGETYQRISGIGF